MVEIQTKNWFSGTFLGVFGLHPPLPYESRPIFCQMKGFMEIHNAGKFHQYSICSRQVMYFEMFS